MVGAAVTLPPPENIVENLNPPTPPGLPALPVLSLFLLFIYHCLLFKVNNLLVRT